MKSTPILFALLSLASQVLLAQSTPPAAEQIAATTQAGPEELRLNATVLGYNMENEIVELRSGTNDLVCLADDPNKEGFKAVCYHSSLADFMERGRKLQAEGKSRNEVEEIRAAEAKSGTLKMPNQPATLHVLYGKEASYNTTSGLVENAQLRYVVYIPWATQKSTGLPLKPMAPGGPWIMFPGAYNAHIMITPPAK